jgi:hypothetical protein
MRFRDAAALIAGMLVVPISGTAPAQELPTGVPTSFQIKGVPVTVKGIAINRAWVERTSTSGNNSYCTLYVVFANLNSSSKYVELIFDGVGPDYIVKSQYYVGLSLQRPNTWAKRSDGLGLSPLPFACNSNIIDSSSSAVIDFLEFNGALVCDSNMLYGC